jgi:methylenetetrahydrofolate dehydrogenase (NADP+)/methenyltetrahydrofolate cyclohydrolase
MMPIPGIHTHIFEKNILPMKIINGNLTAKEIKTEIALEVESLTRSRMKRPHLAAVLVGHDGGSETYVAYKIKDCEEVGFRSSLIRFEDDVTEEVLLNKIDELNQDAEVDGFIIQLPLPDHINEQKVIEAIDPEKDVDGFHPLNVGKTVIGLPSYISATPFGILELLKRYKIETSGKNCVIVGRSNIVGRPLSVLMSQKAVNATVTVAHSRTKDLKKVCREADILIAALGSPEFIKADMVKEGAVVIDVGTTRVPSTETKSGFRLKGDVAFDEVAPRCSFITPVPGGVGPMTRVSLLTNTMIAVKKKF